jgi:sec-independent protein translocase protein TatB
MFDIGFSELLVVAVVALLVLGPERLPRAARFAGLWVRRARAQWHSVRSELETELADEDMRRSILRARDELRDAQAELQRDGERLRAQLRDVEARMTLPAAPSQAGSDAVQAAGGDVAPPAPVAAGAGASHAGPLPGHNADDVYEADAAVAASVHDGTAAAPAPATDAGIGERGRDAG